MSDTYRQQLAAQNLGHGLTLSIEQASIKAIIDRIENAEKIYPAGSHQHGVILRAPLESEWPTIKAKLISDYKLWPWFR